jgi:exosome complex RNA-binding protein Rrp42 (RNase PH superfamily)
VLSHDLVLRDALALAFMVALQEHRVTTSSRTRDGAFPIPIAQP